MENSVTKDNAVIRTISLLLDNVRINLGENKTIKVNDQTIQLPHQIKEKIDIAEQDKYVVVTSKIGIKVRWNLTNELEIIAPSSYRDKLCGLCGNYNLKTKDDMTTPEGILVKDPSVFAQSWTSGNEICLNTRKYGATGCHPLRDSR